MEKYRVKKKGKIFKRFMLVSLIIMVILSTIIFTGFYAITADAKLDYTKLDTTKKNIIILANNGSEIGGDFGATDTTNINSNTKNAFIAKEDKRFYSHHGIDYIRMAGALKNNISTHSFGEGGSTITQQLIKNTHLSQDKTIKRKLNEIKLAKELERNISKEEILDTYLNSIYFGNNLFGIRQASSFYFNKTVDKLTIAESAVLAGLISAPSVYNPVQNLSLSKSKASIVLSLMKEQGFITEDEFNMASGELKELKVVANKSVASVYMSAVMDEVLEILGLRSLPKNTDIKIETYLNLGLQTDLEKRLESEIYKAKDDTGTMSGIVSIVVDNNTGGIIALSGISEYNILNLKRQPASTIKPILVYAPAIEKNLISPASFILDEPINIDGYSPNNATKKYYGYTTIRDNLVRSTNIPAVKVLNETGLEYSKGFATKCGLNFSDGDNNLAIALGGLNEGSTIKELATAYTTLARGGNCVKTHFVKKININGITAYKNSEKGKQVMKESTAYLITDMLKSVATYGTGRNINSLKIPVASKTGTNAINDINHDGFNASYTTEHTTISWCGNLGPVASVSSSQYNGSLYPTFISRDNFEYLYNNHSPADFTMPETVTKVYLDEDSYFHHELKKADGESNIVELFSTDNIPPAIPKVEVVDNIIENITPTDFEFDYHKFIKNIGIW